MLERTIGQLAAGEDLSRDDMSEAIDAVMQGRCTAGEIGLLLTGLRQKGETVAEIARRRHGHAAAHGPYPHHTVWRDRHLRAGWIHSGTFNISTAAALVTAAAGAPVAKHGNRRVTSKTGSADVLMALGVNIQADVALVEACLDELGICFCFAPLMHPAMKQVAAVRQKLGTPTIFNLLGPLTNPTGAQYQLIGVGRAEHRVKLAEALVLLGVERALVVGGEDGLGEVTLNGATQVLERGRGPRREFSWRPEDFEIEPCGMEPLLVDNPEQSAEVIRTILSGDRGPPRDIVVLNAAAALFTVGRTQTPAECARLAEAAIDSGAAKELLARLVEKTN